MECHQHYDYQPFSSYPLVDTSISPAEPAGTKRNCKLEIHRSMVIITMDLPRNASLEDKQVQPLTYESQAFCVLSLGGEAIIKKKQEENWKPTCVAK